MVAEAKAGHRTARRVYRPWVPSPGGHLVIDWTPAGGLQMFGAVLAWCRYRFVRLAADQRRPTTLRLLAECFEEIGGVPGAVLSDRMAGLRVSQVAGLVVPHPDYVRFAAHHGFRPRLLLGGRPGVKGGGGDLMGYAQRDLVVPVGVFASAEAANESARAWCAEVNGQVHSEICAIPAKRLVAEVEHLRPLPELRTALMAGVARKVDRLACVRLGSARYSVPHALVGHQVMVAPEGSEVVIRHDGQEVARHALVAPGQVSIRDEHYGGPRPRPARGPRPRTGAERAFLALGEPAEAFLVGAAAAGTPRLAFEITEIGGLEAAFGCEALVGALGRAHRFGRYRAADVRAILLAGAGVAEVTGAGTPLQLALPAGATRPLSAYADWSRP